MTTDQLRAAYRAALDAKRRRTRPDPARRHRSDPTQLTGEYAPPATPPWRSGSRRRGR